MTGYAKALGMIETWGYPALIAAADAAAKTADVQVTAYEKADAGIVTVYVLGDVASVQTAIEAGGEAAKRVGKLLATHVIPRPDASVFAMVEGLLRQPPPQPEPEPEPRSGSDVPSGTTAPPDASANIPSRQEEEAGDIPIAKPFPSMEELGQWKVKPLREFAAGLDAFPLSAEQLAKTGKAELLRLLAGLSEGDNGTRTDGTNDGGNGGGFA
ncbi:BMC domain-containing protein [Cohnella suwonensis]|uniref:BMC domain-containing protein n=1 Tax=Cohnella suwonensis TaxID=696072 RepID=A0ABW0LVG3_9BACL